VLLASSLLKREHSIGVSVSGVTEDERLTATANS
jgi:hypothetical protein